ncbi:hypothetical protein NKG94_28075 [Micromonospora sp. M12]
MIALLLSRRRPVDLYTADAVLAVLVGGLLCPYAALESPLHGGVREPLWCPCSSGWPSDCRWRSGDGGRSLSPSRSAPSPPSPWSPGDSNFAAAAPAFAIGLAFYTVAVSTPTRRSMLCAAGCLALVSVGLVLTAGDLWSRTGGVAYAAVMITPAWLIGWLIRERRALAVRQSDHLVRQAATEERLRVAGSCTTWSRTR